MANNTEQDKMDILIRELYTLSAQDIEPHHFAVKARQLIEAEATRRAQAVYKRAYSAGYNAASNKEKNRYGHSHEWSISPNQDDTGTVGVRKVCNICNLEMVIYDQKLHAELKRQAKGGK